MRNSKFDIKGHEKKQTSLQQILLTIKRGQFRECVAYLCHSCMEATFYSCKTGINLVVTPFSVPHTCTKCYSELP